MNRHLENYCKLNNIEDVESAMIQNVVDDAIYLFKSYNDDKLLCRHALLIRSLSTDDIYTYQVFTGRYDIISFKDEGYMKVRRQCGDVIFKLCDDGQYRYHTFISGCCGYNSL